MNPQLGIGTGINYGIRLAAGHLRKIRRLILKISKSKNEKICLRLHRCGWCGHPTDKDGKLIHTDNPGEYVEKMIDASAKEVLVNGECCPGGHETRDNPPTREMLMDAGLL